VTLVTREKAYRLRITGAVQAIINPLAIT